MMNNGILVILPYTNEKAQGREIELALGLWRKFCMFDYHFIVVGTFDDTLPLKFDWVEFIKYCPEVICDGKYWQLMDVQHKIEKAINLHPEYSDMILTHDDWYPIRSFSIEDIRTTHYLSSTFRGEENKPYYMWNHAKWKTRCILDEHNLPHVNYSTHFPFYYEIDKLRHIWDIFDTRNMDYVQEDLYYNYYKQDIIVPASDIRLGIVYIGDKFRVIPEMRKNDKIKFIFNSPLGWCKELEEELDGILNETILYI